MAGDIYLDTTSTTAGIKPLFWFVPVRDVASQDGATITLKSGKQWHTAKGSKFKSSVETANVSAKLYRVGFSATVAHISPALEKVINSYTVAEGYLVIYEDLNGYRWLLGSLEQPLKLRHRYQSGNRPGSSTGVRLTFSGSQLGAPRLEYTDSIDASTPVPPPTGAQVSIINSDVSYSDAAPCGSQHILPDIIITDYSGNNIPYPAAKSFHISSIAPLPDTWEEMAAAYGIGYCLPQPSGQSTSYRTGDDKWLEDNVLAAARLTNDIKPKNHLVNWFTLKHNNKWGNTYRWTDEYGGRQFGEAYLDDYTTDEDNTTTVGNNVAIIGGQTYGGKDACLRCYISGSGSASVHGTIHYWSYYNKVASNEGIGKTYRITGEVYIPTGQSINGIQLYDGSSTMIQSITTTGSWVPIDVTHTFNNNQLRIYLLISGSNYWAAAGTEGEVYLRNIKIEEYPSNGSRRYYTIDNYTSLGWYMKPLASTDWNGAIDGALGTKWGGPQNMYGYDDWFLPTYEMGASVNWGMPGTYAHPFYFNPFYWSGYNYWMSTTSGYTTKALLLSYGKQMTLYNKTSNAQYFISRLHAL